MQLSHAGDDDLVGLAVVAHAQRRFLRRAVGDPAQGLALGGRPAEAPLIPFRVLREMTRQLRREIDLERIERVLNELEQSPERWLAIYNRIHELKRRRAPDSPN